MAFRDPYFILKCSQLPQLLLTFEAENEIFDKNRFFFHKFTLQIFVVRLRKVLESETIQQIVRNDPIHIQPIDLEHIS